MFLSSLAIRRPVLTVVMSVLLLVLGVMAMQRLSVRQYPDIDKPRISISTTYIGASSGVMESEVTRPMEEAISGIEGITLVTSSSTEEASSVNIEFSLERNIDFAAADVREAVGRAVGSLPEEADDPVIRKASSSSNAMMWITLSSDEHDQLQLTDFADKNLVDPISVVPGVATVIIGGQRRYAMRIWLDREMMASTGITAADVVRRLQEENLELPAGRLESRQRELTVRTTTRFTTPDEFRDLVIRTDGITQIRLADIARVEVGAANYRSALIVDGQPSVGLGVIRQSKSNTVAVADAVRERVLEMRDALPEGMHLDFSYDESQFIKASIDEVVKALAIALTLVVLVIMLFLQSARATIVPAVTIPISIIATTIVMASFGFSINVLTLLAAVLAIGLVVDDSIVVLENIYRRNEAGEPALLAADNGSRQVGFAVIATTLTLVSVFVPISFMQGTVGRLFTEFGIALAAAVVFSSFVALTLTPMLCSKILRDGRTAGGDMKERGAISRQIERVLLVPETWYAASLRWSLRSRAIVIGVTVVVSALAYLLFLNVPEELAPTEDRGFIVTIIFAPEGASLEYTSARVLEVEAVIEKYKGPTGPIDRTITIVAPGWGGNSPVNFALVLVRMKDWHERDRAQQDVVAELFPQLYTIPGVRAFAVNPPSLGLPYGEPINYVVGGSDHETVQGWADVIVAAASGNPNLVNVRADYDNTKPQIEVEIDRRLAADLGVSGREIGVALQVMLGGRNVTQYTRGDEQYDVIIQADDIDRRSPSDISNMYIRTDGGDLLPLSSVATLVERGRATSLERVNRQAAVSVTASLVGDYTVGEALDYLDGVAKAQLPRAATVTYLGQSREYAEASGGLWVTFGFAILIVFLVLAAQFESFVHPFIILISVPLATTGGLAALWMTGITLNIYSQIGMILLVGLMAKNGILIVEFANQLRDEGMSIDDAAYEASRIRLRPIVMTSVSTVLGAVPLAIASGAGAEGREAIGDVIIGGVTLATFLTLYVIPVLYAMLARFTKPAGATERLLRAQQREAVDLRATDSEVEREETAPVS